ncbi:GtrA family protein [Bacillota bacterium Meth-B3]|nr:GtrA family protein [Christensenellaceae bacterium]MEA5065518.1 GtrA family protein [Eubacteriales bacterium]MEA5068552.1 GtrA family protein [Christensenellaceae bacterium]
MRKLFDRSLWIFILIGIGNTALSFVIMQGLNRLWGEGYWAPSAIAYVLTSLLSYVLNKRFSFQNADSVASTAWRFALVIGACYLIAHLIARPATNWALRQLPATSASADQIAMAVAQVLFTGLNYLGQRFFAFKKRPE